MSTEPNSSFKICLTMAGAVSAGAYTAGVIDYLLETLHLWQKAKNKNRAIKEQFPDDFINQGYDPSVPMHDVTLEVVGGASAGGITSTLTFLSLLGGHSESAGKKDSENILYESWVTMSDTADSDHLTLTRLLSNSDIDASQKVESLLNTQPIELIADKNLKIRDLNDPPDYVSKDLDLILTVSNLRGLKYKIIFKGSDEDAGNCITTHSGFFRYRLKNSDQIGGIPTEDHQLYFMLTLDDPDHGDIRSLKEATLSTAAFPIGLKPRKNNVPRAYVERYKQYLFATSDGVKAIIPESDPFHFTSVDGGLFNNEPFGYTLKTLKEKHPAVAEKKNYAMIMIDPFPNYFSSIDPFEEESDIITIGKRIFVALRNQALFKQDDIIDALNDANDTRFLVAPSRKFRDELTGLNRRAENPLACGALAGFSGFLSKKFREHDFSLGRANCQSFLRYWFALSEQEAEDKLNAPFEPEAFDRFAFSVPPKTSKEDGGQFFVPIIPDMKALRAFDNIYDEERYGEEANLSSPDFPMTTIKEIEAEYKDLALKRIKKIRKILIPQNGLNLILSVFGVDKKLYNKLIGQIESGLKSHGLIN